MIGSQNLKTALSGLALGLFVLLAGCGISTADEPGNLQNFGQAPELKNEVWINSDQPLRLADLRGNVVLLEMWTYG